MCLGATEIDEGAGGESRLGARDVAGRPNNNSVSRLGVREVPIMVIDIAMVVGLNFGHVIITRSKARYS